jgi:hypothetical protein
LIAQTGCDSTVLTNLTVLPSLSSSFSDTACVSYNWNGQLYTQSGSYTQVFQGMSGCDSTVNLTLTINTLSAAINQNGVNLTALPAGAMYQWIDCDNPNNVLQNATGQSYIAVENGNFAVIVTDSNCSDTSDCVNVSNVGLDFIDILNEFKVYPNPFNSALKIDFAGVSGEKTILIYDIFGKTCFNKTFESPAIETVQFEGENGVYFIELLWEGKSKIIKLIKSE